MTLLVVEQFLQTDIKRCHMEYIHFRLRTLLLSYSVPIIHTIRRPTKVQNGHTHVLLPQAVTTQN